ncbi:hypothetical protein PQR46_41780 [Paraburkholderia sediminicola]|uniref:hypothetical protein n=1 Tax=Paraburkholderia sediminicola TaxID=458836 RepID=UPI0038B9E9CF
MLQTRVRVPSNRFIARFRRASVVLVAAALSAGVTQTAHAEAPISKIVNEKIIGTTLKYAEFQIGSPAMLEWKDSLGIQRNIYEKGECRIELGVQANKVVSVSMYISNTSCDLDAGQISFGHIAGRKVTQTTFNDWAAWRLEPHFSDPGLPSCNACQEDRIEVYERFPAFGVFGMLELQVGSSSPGKGYDTWRDMLYNAGVDGDKLPVDGESCPLHRFDAQAQKLMGNARVASIAIGRPGTLQPACSAVTIQRPREP